MLNEATIHFKLNQIATNNYLIRRNQHEKELRAEISALRLLALQFPNFAITYNLKANQIEEDLNLAIKKFFTV